MPPLFLVTGPDGWLGSRLVADLRTACPDAEIRGMTGDLRQTADCDRFVAGARDAVLFHTAGVIHPNRVREFYEVNEQGTKNLLAAARAAGVRRVVAVSSNSPFGVNPTREHRFDESSPYNPYMNYGRSKMLMEMAVKAAATAGGIETVIVRAPWFYGPGQPPRQSLFFKMIRDGKAPIVGDGNSPRSMAYVDNLALGLRLAAEKARSGSVYWIADERPYTMNEIVDTVEDLFEKDFDVRCAHKRMRLPDVASEIALLADKAIQGAGLYNSKIHVLSEMNKTIACTIARAQAEIGYRPPVDLREGMRRSLKWCFENGQLP
jgi:nucleoside-diphosphate-sugar epimerase